jgi:ribosome-binding protein aMBF1 (putative translation factor)
MSDICEYENAVGQAKTNLADIRERGGTALGSRWDDVRNEIFTPEELNISDLRVAMMVELVRARKEQGISQKKLERLSGVKQPIIARMERGSTSPQIDTVLKVLAALEKTLVIMPLR